jgi:hypothetical protein
VDSDPLSAGADAAADLSGKTTRYNMPPDIFGDLRYWGRVLERLEELRASRLLDEHQLGLARILRYRRNWQLMERALSCALEIRQASDILIAEVLNVLVSPEVYLEARVSAAEALGHLIPRRPPQESTLFDEKRALQTMDDLVQLPGLPRLQQAVSRALAVVHASK